MKMGARHLDYGTKPEHYPVVAGALLGAMAELARPIWTPQLEEDWTAAVNAIARVMLKGAENSGRFRAAA